MAGEPQQNVQQGEPTLNPINRLKEENGEQLQRIPEHQRSVQRSLCGGVTCPPLVWAHCCRRPAWPRAALPTPSDLLPDRIAYAIFVGRDGRGNTLIVQGVSVHQNALFSVQRLRTNLSSFDLSVDTFSVCESAFHPIVYVLSCGGYTFNHISDLAGTLLHFQQLLFVCPERKVSPLLYWSLKIVF